QPVIGVAGQRGTIGLAAGGLAGRVPPGQVRAGSVCRTAPFAAICQGRSCPGLWGGLQAGGERAPLMAGTRRPGRDSPRWCG
ncbi:MAG: hypothetical protein ACLPQY_23145, partial [Streptosporangiaceae bacterium]